MTMWVPRVLHGKARYLAIADALAADVANGALAPGARLPTHRALADRLGVTIGTVTRAYAEARRRGLISGEVGRGTFVRASPTPDLPRLGPIPGAIDLSLGSPPDADRHTIATHLARTLREIAASEEVADLTRSGLVDDLPTHRLAGAAWIRRAGFDAAPAQVLVTTGAQHAITVILAAMTHPGDTVAAAELGNPGIRAACHLLHLRSAAVSIDGEGLVPDSLLRLIEESPVRILYCTPTLHNPTTATMPERRRREIAEIARAHGILVIEDEYYGALLTERPPAIASLLPEQTFFVASTSALDPCLRIGYVAAVPGTEERVRSAIRTVAWIAAPLQSAVAARWIEDGTADSIAAWRRAEAAERNAMANAILTSTTVASRRHGFHVWLHLPEWWRSEEFAHEALARGVRVASSAYFTFGRSVAPNAVRVGLGGSADRTDLRRGLETIAELLRARPRPRLSVR